jgi:transposase-like protein
MELKDLPSPETRRWTPRRKAQIVLAVQDRVITREGVKRIYNMSDQELISWEKRFRMGDTKALRVYYLPKDTPKSPRKRARIRPS